MIPAGPWTLTRLVVGGEDIDLADAVITLEHAHGAIAGSAGVNRYRAQVEGDGDALTVGPIATTMMAGPPERMAAEQAFVGALEGDHALERTGDRLRLRTGAATLEFIMPDTTMDDWLAEHPEWELAEGILRTERDFPDFATAFAFATRVALAAERAFHHPEITVTWGKVTIELVTHEADGAVTDKDRELAASIDELG